MVPAAIVVRDALPTTPNGKLDRKQLARWATRLASDTAVERAGRPPTPPTPPTDAVEAELALIWTHVLGRDDIGREDSFFDLGGHSLAAVRLMARIRERFGRELPLAVLYRAATIERLAVLLRAGSAPAARVALVELTPAAAGARRQETRRARPLFCVHPAGGNVLCYAELARALGPDQPLYGLQLPDPARLGPVPTVEAMAAHYLAELPAVAPTGPYALSGWSLGGAIAYEMARQLRAAGEAVELLALIDPAPLPRPPPAAETAPGKAAGDSRLRAQFLRDLVALSAVAGNGAAVAGDHRGGNHRGASPGRGNQAAPASDPSAPAGEPSAPAADDARRLDPALPLPGLVAAAQAAGLLPLELGPVEVARLFDLFRTTRQALDRYRPAPYPGRLALLLAAHRPANGAIDPAAAWAALAGAGSELELLPGDHYSIVRQPAVAALAGALRRRFAAGERLGARG